MHVDREKNKRSLTPHLKKGDCVASLFIPEHVGKMQFYLAVLDDKVRLEGENPSIGIILCKSKKKTVVEYALKDANKPINVASYHLVKKLPKDLQNELPSPEQMARFLENIEYDAHK